MKLLCALLVLASSCDSCRPRAEPPAQAAAAPARRPVADSGAAVSSAGSAPKIDEDLKRKRDAAAEKTIRELRGKPLDESQWRDLAGAFALLNYAAPPERPPARHDEQQVDFGILDRRAPATRIRGGPAVPPEAIAAKALPLLPEGAARAWARRLLRGVEATIAEGEPGWAVWACGAADDIDGATDRPDHVGLLAWISDKRVIAFSASAGPTGWDEANVCSVPQDVVDIDGDGVAELVTHETYSEGDSLAVRQIVNDKPVTRWTGGGSGF